MGLGKLHKKVMLCLREPSMGPIFGIKGGGTGGGYAQVGPMEDINLHFNGDFHAVTAAHNLLAAALDASIYNGNPLGIDPSSVMWPRTLDMNDRELRYTVVGLGGKAHGVPRENQFVITAASEVMAVFALSSDLQDLRQRLGRIVVASTYTGDPVTAEMLRVAGAMTVVMKDAIKPNLVQTREGQPALVHAGPFGNIAHAANSIIADRIALKAADYVVTEAGFASDLGFQKFCDIVCRVGGFAPSAAVLVTTVRATKSHGGKPFKDLALEDLVALRKGADNLAAHVHIVKQYGLPCVVAINSFPTDPPAELALVRELALAAGAETVVARTGLFRRRRRHHGTGHGGGGGVLQSRTRSSSSRRPGRRSPSRSGDCHQALMAPPTWIWSRRRGRTSRRSRSSASARRRCAWPRRTCRCRTTGTCATGRRASRCRCARWCRAPAPGSWWRSAARCSGCRGWARRRRSTTSTSTPTGIRWDFSSW
jgi:hypothetical protein